MQTVDNLLINGATPVTVGGLGVTAKYFPQNPGASIGVASSKVGYLKCPGGNSANNQLLHVIANGNVAPDPTIACPTFRIELVATLNATVASPTYVSIADSGAVAPGAQTGDAVSTQPWGLQAWLQVDDTGGVMQGFFSYQVGGDLASLGDHELSNVFINVDMNPTTGLAPFYLAVRATFGTTAANNTASMYQFALEQ